MLSDEIRNSRHINTNLTKAKDKPVQKIHLRPSYQDGCTQTDNVPVFDQSTVEVMNNETSTDSMLHEAAHLSSTNSTTNTASKLSDNVMYNEGTSISSITKEHYVLSDCDSSDTGYQTDMNEYLCEYTITSQNKQHNRSKQQLTTAERKGCSIKKSSKNCENRKEIKFKSRIPVRQRIISDVTQREPVITVQSKAEPTMKVSANNKRGKLIMKKVTTSSVQKYSQRPPWRF